MLLQLPPLAGREWFELLRQKLIPYSASRRSVVAVVGGTNIGKSVIFNHLAGSSDTATSPLASGTKHVTCLVPEGFNAQHNLKSVFPDFELHEWTDPTLGLRESEKRIVCSGGLRKNCRLCFWCLILLTSTATLTSTGSARCRASLGRRPDRGTHSTKI